MQSIDIAIAGSGISCTATLIEVFRRLIDGSADQRKITITVFEKYDELWMGIPYGSRSSVNALTITSVYDFFTAENERAPFFEWFKNNKNELIDYYLQAGGLTAKQWLQRNGTALDDEDYKSVFLPRFMCGRYLQSRFDDLLNIAQERELVILNTITAEVIDASPNTGGGYVVTYEFADKTINALIADKAVIATGSAPVKVVMLPADPTTVTLINNLYEPGVDDNIKTITDALAATPGPEQRNILMIGSNASSIEFLYLLAGLPDVTALINKLVVLSRSGLFPYHIINKQLESYPCPNLDRLAAQGNYTIDSLVATAMADLQAAVKDGVIVAYVDRIIGYTLELLQALDEDAKNAFLGIHGMRLSNQFRRSGKDYKGGETFLLGLRKLIMLKGGFENITPTANGGLLTYSNDGEERLYDTSFKVVINCTGANDLDRSSSRLIYNLIHNGIAKANLSGKGFYVNEKFEAAPNLYVIGPLLGGNKNERIHFWHLENASRILYLAPYLAECLLAGLPG